MKGKNPSVVRAAMFQALVENSPTGVVLLDSERRLVYASRAASGILGYSPEELVGKDAMRLMHPNDWEGARRAFEQLVLLADHRLQRTFRVCDRVGRWRWIEATAANLLQVEAVQAVAVHFHEITALQQEVEEFRVHAEASRRILEGCAGGILVTNSDGEITEANLEGLRLTAVSREDVLKLRVADFEGRVFREDDTVMPLEEFPSVKCLRTGCAEPPTTIGVRRRDGSMRWILCLAMPLAVSEAGKASSVVMTLLDITERRRMEAALQNAREEHDRIMGAIPDYVWSLVVRSDGSLNMRYISPAVERITGRPAEFFMEDEGRWLMTVHPEDRSRVAQVAGRLISGALDREELEYRIVRADGVVRVVRDNVRAHIRQDGLRQLQGVVSDVTERRLMEDALRKGEETLRLAMEVSSLGFWNMIVSSGEMKWSDSLYHVCGREPGSFSLDPASIFELVHPEDRGRVLLALDSARQTETAAAEFRVTLPDGSVRWLAAKGRFVRDATGDLSRMVGVAADITERVTAEEKLRLNADELRGLSRQLIEVQETERLRLSRELHDQVGQALTAVQINLQSLPELSGSGAMSDGLTESVRIVEEALELVRNLSLDLRPLLLDDLGLVAALRWYTNRWAQRAGLRSVFQSNLPPTRIDPAVETACFRVAQEALTNVVRHAGAASVVVELGFDQNWLKLSVLDDGGGLKNGRGLGLVGMEERVSLAGGTLRILSEPAKGTRVEACFPLTLPALEGRVLSEYSSR